LTIILAPNQVNRAVGAIRMHGGKYDAYGQELTINKGELAFTGGPLTNPNLNVQATKDIDSGSAGVGSVSASQITVGVNVQGTLDRPKLSLFSIPTMSSADILSYMITGQASGNLTSGNSQIVANAASALNLIGDSSVASLTSKIRQGLGLSEFGLQSGSTYDANSDSTEGNTAFVLGKYLTPKLLVSYSMGLIVNVNTFTAQYFLTKHWSIQADTSNQGTGADVFFTGTKWH